MRIFQNHITSIFFIFCVTACHREQREIPAYTLKDTTTLFTLLDPSETKLIFSNNLREGMNTNILMYEYFYNGGGVSTADLNGDGLTDIYLTSNMEENRLFLNMGNMQFQDITHLSGTSGRKGPWKTGVTIADVNGDTLPDIYVCYSGMVKEENRKNQLFINTGNDSDNIPHFTEQAEAYGLASAGYSNQGYFFDYDRDGDLDMLLLNHNPTALPILNEVSTAAMLKKDDPMKGVRLFRQTNKHFEDITLASGINGSELTYGLGAGIADLNNDQWPDIYISNDYSVPDYLYINNQDGTFTNKLQEALGHTSQFSMGNDIADINHDGHPDIITLDMLPEDNRRQKLLMAPDNYAKFDLNVRSGFYFQYMRNMLHLNNGNNTFSEVGQLAGISNTDWSWAALLADFDNSGSKDLLVTNGYVRDYTNLDFIKYMDDFVKTKGRLKREDVLEIIQHMPSSNVVNYLFSNESGVNFSNRTKAWGLHHVANSNGAAYADLDNDGDLDLVINNINQQAFLYRNGAEKMPDHHFLEVKLQGVGLNTQGIGARVSIWSNQQGHHVTQMPSRGYLSSVSPVLHFGLGPHHVIDSLVVQWPGGTMQSISNVKADQVLTLKELDAIPFREKKKKAETIFTRSSSPVVRAVAGKNINDFKRQPLLLQQLSYAGPLLVPGDADNDGLTDIYVSGGDGVAAKLFVQKTGNRFTQKSIKAFEAGKNYFDADAAFLDANGDGFQDLYVASGGYHNFSAGDPLLQDRLYLNNGKGDFIHSQAALPEMKGSKGCIAIADFNGDGHPDIFVGGRSVPGRYPEAPESFLLINNGQGKFENQIDRIAPSLKRSGMITDAIWMDLNQDSKNDLVIAGEWMPLSVYINDGKTLENQTSAYFSRNYSGWWNKIDTADVNNDGLADLIAGNMGLNTQCKATDKEPAEIFFKDFDNNGSVDPFFCFFIQGKSYPYVTRDELLEQIGSLRSRFTDYKSYADITLKEIFTEQDLKSAGHLTANHLETTLFIREKNGRFNIAPLPAEAQYAPVHTITALDHNQDGNVDILLCGNNSNTKIKIGKSDANYGILLTGNGKGQFNYVKQTESGFALTGDVRSVAQLGQTLLFGINQRPVAAYKLNTQKKTERTLASVGSKLKQHEN